MRCLALVSALLLCFASSGHGLEKSLLSGSELKPSSDQLKVTREGTALRVSIAAGKGDYPGLRFEPPTGVWNFSKFGHVEATLVNTGEKPLTLALRVDNAGNWQDNPWNTESVTLAPGQTGTLRTVFGYQYGLKKGFALDTAKVTGVLIFTTKTDAPESFTVESLDAGGTAGEGPPIGPDDLRIGPAGGLLFGGSKATSAELRFEGGAGPFAATNTPGFLPVSFPSGSPNAVAKLRPPQGRWDLRDYTEVEVTLRNVGSGSIAPRVRLESNGGISPWRQADQPLAPGTAAEMRVPFGHLVDLNQSNQSDLITSDSVASIDFSTVSSDRESHLVIERVAAKTVSPAIPAWLGKRPPLSGDWTVTLNQTFDRRLDPTVWKATGENYYDKQTHWSRDDVLLKDGLLRLRYEKKTGFQNDDPKRNSTPYAAGYLDTFGLWAQRYGYFEARMKLPKSPGLWPAFWMMPDRGSKGGPEQWKRQDTANGGMEFDIMEHLTRWGSHRYNIAMHWDGYGKDHKSVGCEKLYVDPDKDGFITCGLLWTPGQAVYYCNGREILHWSSPKVSSVPSILMFTLPSGGWDNDAVDDAKLPADFLIEYVRVWQRKDLASPDDGRRVDPQK